MPEKIGSNVLKLKQGRNIVKLTITLPSNLREQQILTGINYGSHVVSDEKSRIGKEIFDAAKHLEKSGYLKLEPISNEGLLPEFKSIPRYDMVLTKKGNDAAFIFHTLGMSGFSSKPNVLDEVMHRSD